MEAKEAKPLTFCEECGKPETDLCMKCGNRYCEECIPPGYTKIYDEDTEDRVMLCENCHPDNGWRCELCGQVLPEHREVKIETRPSRNAPCPCKSGKKWKNCCGKTSK